MPAPKTSWISRLVPGDGDPRHGYTGYSNLGCRCSICRDAKRAYQADLRARRALALASGEIEAQHGTRTTYQEYGCRCSPCIQAQRDHKVDYARRQSLGGAA